ncbi:putative regulator of Ras-like GTPase activity (Roadblock/LC7/MglB family) [Nonomuraea fuscirosea]|uniref:Putative regulator of Ras-like GTPase activity (Roadblock/LC7/MglB family) n=1 Tax=Nonomuraea fuscirosea TaxID=1291556 RepID=A0A2T0LSZ2_9ACTN|nr:roadblock/LC7 domain-containing protein [Nonomuraea fuscirosea]PRX46789.1 putative regulator of Ras-like GTPase activity (Roadblock/LC7/MglB family) [Nonomuraea fuscirosea]
MNDKLSWMLDDVLSVPGAHHAILLSADGLLRAHSSRISRDKAERHAAALAGLQSLSRSTEEFCTDKPTSWRQTLVEFADGYVFVIAAGPGAYLAVSGSEEIDLEIMTYRMHKMVDRLGKELTVPPRTPGLIS